MGGVNGAGGRPPQQPRPPRPQVKPSAWLKITRKSYFQVLAPSPPDFRALIKEALLKHDAGIQDAGSSGDDGDEGPENFEDVVHRFIYVKRYLKKRGWKCVMADLKTHVFIKMPSQKRKPHQTMHQRLFTWRVAFQY